MAQVLLLGINFAEGYSVKVRTVQPLLLLTRLTFPQKALESFYGIGKQISVKVLAKHHIHPTAKMGSLKSQLVTDLQQHLTSMNIENQLRNQMQANIKLLRDIGTYRGRRHAMGLPVRGQRTRTNVSPCSIWRLG